MLDASASAGVTQVQFELSQGTVSDGVIATATPTIYGWIALWDSTTKPSGTYTLQSVATSGGSSGTSPGISITVNNPNPSVSIVLPPSGATVSGTQAVLDAVATPGVDKVTFGIVASGCPPTGPPPAPPLCEISAIPTIYGWIALWDSTEVANGSYPFAANAQYADLQGGTTPVTSIDVANQGPTVVVPANDSTVSGTQVLDCVSPPGTTGAVLFQLGGSVSVLGEATLTYYGWLFEWNTSSVTNGAYSIYCEALYPFGGYGFGPGTSVTVAN